MRPSLWIVSAVLLGTAGVGQAQFYGGFAQRQAVAVSVRTGPHSGFTYVQRSYGFGYPSPYVTIPPWYYSPYYSPYAVNPFFNQQPPVVINNNIIQAAAPARGAVGPPDLGPVARVRPRPFQKRSPRRSPAGRRSSRTRQGCP